MEGSQRHHRQSPREVLFPDPSSIPWLLLAATPSGATNGALSKITLVRRSDTHGGNALSTGCDAQHDGKIFRAHYTATYTFYTQP